LPIVLLGGAENSPKLLWSVPFDASRIFRTSARIPSRRGKYEVRGGNHVCQS
jgi:hypothetical protein